MWWLTVARQGTFRVFAARGPAGQTGPALVQLEYSCVQYQPLVQCGTQRPVQAVLQVKLSLPPDDMGEEVSVERRVFRQDLLQIEHVLRGDELIEPDGPGRYLCPFAGTSRMIGIGTSLSDLLEDHRSESRSARPEPLTRIPSQLRPEPCRWQCSPARRSPDSADRTSSQPNQCCPAIRFWPGIRIPDHKPHSE
jgi:hypothetical protein